jgi:hypothetical protein
MRYAIHPLLVLASSTLVACSFQLRAGTAANQPMTPAPQAPAANPAPQPQASTPPSVGPKGPPIKRLGKRPAGQATGPTPTPTTPATPVIPTNIPIVTTATIFGGNTVDASGFKGSVYWVDKNTTKVPPLDSMQIAGALFTREINVAPQAFTSGFPGIDEARKENFAIRYEAPLLVSAESDYDFRLLADDAAILRIDGLTIVENDGLKSAPADKTGPVHLVVGTHVITVDYLQTKGNVALQLFCKKVNDAEKICPTQL